MSVRKRILPSGGTAWQVDYRDSAGVVIETAAAMEPAEIDQSGVVPAGAVPQYVRDIYREVKDRGPGPHVLTGPVFVNGAMPGDVVPRCGTRRARKSGSARPRTNRRD